MEVGLPRIKRSRIVSPISDIFGLLVKRFAVLCPHLAVIYLNLHVLTESQVEVSAGQVNDLKDIPPFCSTSMGPDM